MSKKSQFLFNAIVLFAMGCYLIWNFTVKDMWGLPQIFVIIVLFISALSQIYIRFFLLKDASPKKRLKPLDKEKKL